MIDFPESVKKIIEIYASHGESAYAVGGCVRDSLMGRVPSDWDITTSALPERTVEIFESEEIRTIPTGLKHGTVSVLMDGEIFECTTHRVDGSYTDSRRPDSVEFTRRLADDLSRRDFTVNAMAASPAGVFDCFGGISDISARIIRCVGEAEVRFGEDALRILRALRFATVLDFEIEGATLAAAKKLAHTLEMISAERKTVELQKILCSEHADRGAALLFDTEIIKYLLPDAQALPTDMCVLSATPSRRLATLMWQTGGRDLSRLRLSNAEKGDIKRLITPLTFPDTDEGARRALAAVGDLASDAATLQGRPSFAERIKLQESAGAAVTIRQLALRGKDILALGVPDVQVGEVLSFLLDRVMICPDINERGTLLTLVKENFNA